MDTTRIVFTCYISSLKYGCMDIVVSLLSHFLPCQIINFCQYIYIYIYYIVAFATAQVTEKKQGVSVCWAKFGGPAGASDPELFIVQESL